MTCKDVIEFLDDYVAARLSADERARFDEHLALCPPCRDYLKTYQDAIALGRAVLTGEEDATAALPDDLVRAILAARKRES